MAADNFEKCLALTLAFEGGYSDDTHDPGGATNMGVTRAVLAKVRGRPVTKSEVMALSRAEAGGIYRRLFWNTIAGDQLPTGVDAALFDLSVNSGPAHAVRALQIALSLPATGKLDNGTLSSICVTSPAELVKRLCGQRLSFLARLKNFRFFGKGWSRRVAAIEKAALAMVAGSGKHGDLPALANLSGPAKPGPTPKGKETA